jgi:acyl-CoA synthetase (AMP-forming)/AMP-acid ligase II
MHYQLADIFEALCDADPAAEAVHAGEISLNRGQLDARANRLAHHLISSGVKPGDHVGIYAYNRAEWFEALIACWKCRATAVNINFRYVHEELLYMWQNADMVALIYEKGFAAEVERLRPGFAGIRHYLWLDDGTQGHDPTDTKYEDALAGQPDTRGFPERSGDDIYMIYTGGTTGMPKGVMWRHHDFYHNVICRDTKPQRLEDMAKETATRLSYRTLTLSPLMHGGGQFASIIGILSGGVAAVPVSHRFDPEEVLRIVEKHKILMVQIIGDAMARPLAEAQRKSSYDVSSLKAISSGGAILTEEGREKLRQAFGEHVFLTGGIGGSEMGSAAMQVSDGDALSGPRFKAQQLMAVVDDDLNVLEPGSGAEGFLAMRGHVPLGYYKDPEKTAKVFRTDKNGERWALAGDRARVENDGTFTLLGRDSQCINSGGEKIYVEEVERAVAQHPAVQLCAVVGVPDPKWQQRVVAIVEPKPDSDITLDSLQTVCRQHIAGYKIPRELLIAEFPQTPNGKIDYKWAQKFAYEHIEAAGLTAN